jgi:hypothetical protein
MRFDAHINHIPSFPGWCAESRVQLKFEAVRSFATNVATLAFASPINRG